MFGCFFTYRYFINQTEQLENEAVEISSDPIFNAQNYPKVDGSTSTIPLAKAFFENFTSEKAEITHSKTHQSYVNLINGDCDLILVVEPSEDELQYAEDSGVELNVEKVVNEGFVFFVNANNPVDSLTLEEVQKIYSGEITNWSEVGGNDEEIIAYQRPENSGSQTGMLSLVMKDIEMMPAPTENVAYAMSDIIDAVSNYENGNGAIGYSYYFYANTMYLSEDIKLLRINDVEPNNETIKSGEYPIITAYYIVTRSDLDKNSECYKLKEAMLSNRGQKVAEEAGYVPTK